MFRDRALLILSLASALTNSSLDLRKAVRLLATIFEDVSFSSAGGMSSTILGVLGIKAEDKLVG